MTGTLSPKGNFVDPNIFHPVALPSTKALDSCASSQQIGEERVLRWRILLGHGNCKGGWECNQAKGSGRSGIIEILVNTAMITPVTQHPSWPFPGLLLLINLPQVRFDPGHWREVQEK